MHVRQISVVVPAFESRDDSEVLFDNRISVSGWKARSCGNLGGGGEENYFAFSARLSRNTPCSPNMFQNHQGKFTRSGRP